MAIERLSFRGEFEAPKQEFQCKLKTDIANLPTQTKKWQGEGNADNQTAPTGSMALCEEDWSIWILTIDGAWECMYGGEEANG